MILDPAPIHAYSHTCARARMHTDTHTHARAFPPYPSPLNNTWTMARKAGEGIHTAQEDKNHRHSRTLKLMDRRKAFHLEVCLLSGCELWCGTGQAKAQTIPVCHKYLPAYLPLPPASLPPCLYPLPSSIAALTSLHILGATSSFLLLLPPPPSPSHRFCFFKCMSLLV